jgi:hypothetical protein
VESWDSSQLVESSELPVAVEIEVALVPHGEAADGDELAKEPVLYARRVLLPMRPLDLAALLDPGQGGGGAGDEDEDCQYTLAECLDFSQLGLPGADAGGAVEGGLPAGTDAADLAALGDLIQNAPNLCWDQYRSLYGNHPAVRDFCR